MEVRGLGEKERVAFAQGKRGGAKPNPSLATPPLPLPGSFLESCISVATLAQTPRAACQQMQGRGSGFFLRGRWPRRSC